MTKYQTILAWSLGLSYLIAIPVGLIGMRLFDNEIILWVYAIPFIVNIFVIKEIYWPRKVKKA